MCQGVCEEEHKAHICLNKENKDVEVFIGKACACQGLAIESAWHSDLCELLLLDVNAAISKTPTLGFVSYSILRVKTQFGRFTWVVPCSCQLPVDDLRHFCSTISCIKCCCFT